MEPVMGLLEFTLTMKDAPSFNIQFSGLQVRAGSQEKIDFHNWTLQRDF
jgi:hypothetical protein